MPFKTLLLSAHDASLTRQQTADKRGGSLIMDGDMSEKIDRIALVVQGLFERSDSIGYDCVGEFRLLRSLSGSSVEVRLFAENINPNNYPDVAIEHISRLRPWLDGCESSLIIYHWCDGWPYFDRLVLGLPSRLIIRWHNNTPPWFAAPYSREHVARTIRGYNSVLELAQASKGIFWVNSVYTAKQITHLGVEKALVHVVYPLSPFLKTAELEERQEKSDLGDSRPLELLFVGRAVPHKGHKHLVATAAIAQQVMGRRVRVTMVGREDALSQRYVAETKTLAQELMVDVAFPGELSFSSLSEIYRRSDIFLCFSEHEGFGLPVFEAMRVGLPVVGLRSTAVGEFLHCHPLAVPCMDHASAAIRVIAAANPSIRAAVDLWQQQNVLRFYSRDIVADQISRGLVGEHDWPSFGGARSAEIEHQVATIELELKDRARTAVSEWPSIRNLPVDTVDRLVTRYDIEGSRDFVEALRPQDPEREFFKAVMAGPLPTTRRFIGPTLTLVRRVLLSLQVGLVAALNRIHREMRGDFDRVNQSITELGESVQLLRRAIFHQDPVIPAKAEALVGPITNNFGAEYFNGNGSISAYRAYERDAAGPCGQLAKVLYKLFEPTSALDVGCAVGHVVHAWRELGVAAVGYDISAWAVGHAVSPYVQRFDVAHQKITDKYDLIIAYDLVQHIPIGRLDFTIRNLWEACCKYLVIVPTVHSDNTIALGDPTHLIRRDHRWWRAFLEEHGLMLDPIATAALDRSEHSQRFHYTGRVFVARKPGKSAGGEVPRSDSSMRLSDQPADVIKVGRAS